MDRPRLATEIMVTRLMTLAPETHVCEGISYLLRHNISGAPVVDGDRNYLGVFSEKCCMNVLSIASQHACSGGPTEMQKQPAKQFMATRLITLTSEMDVFESIGYLLKHRISGAPVIGSDRQFLGVFSEKTSMRVLIESAYDQLPTCRVGAFMNTDPKRVISEDADLLAVMKIFLDTPYRRLPVLRDGHLIGQVSRRDALRAQDQVAQNMSQHEKDHAILQLSHAADHGAPDGESQPGELAVPEVADFMDRKASTIDPETDLFSIAHLFLNTPYRRLPVLDEGKLVGQVNRHDLLQAAHEVMAVPRPPERNLLYLSSLVDRSEAPL